MKTMNKIIITLFLTFSFNAMASIRIESITLKDNSNLELSEITQAYIKADKTVDFIELNDGSRIEGSEVKNISLSKKNESRIQTRAAVRIGGDGSGG